MFITLWIYLAEGPGFEPGLTGPEPVVLPLDDPSLYLFSDTQKHQVSQGKTKNLILKKLNISLKAIKLVLVMIEDKIKKC